MRGRPLRIAVVALAVWQIAAAALSQVGILPGDDVGTISDRYASAVDPAGYAFSIWGLIYTASLLLAVHQARDERAEDPAVVALRGPLAVAFALNGVWIIAFQQEAFVVAQVVIAALLTALAVGYARLTRAGSPRDRLERWVVYATVGVYLGWATVATVAGASTTLLAFGVEQLVLPAETWAVVLLGIAAVIAAAVTVAGPPEPGFPLAVIWAVVAIVVEQSARGRTGVAIAAGVAAAAVLVALVVREVAPSGLRAEPRRRVRRQRSARRPHG